VNLHAYDMNGNSQYLLPTDDSSAELRGMGQYKGSIFVNQAHTADSSVLRFPLCAKASATHAFSGGTLSHPYGLAIWRDMIFVSNQDTNAISTFNITLNREVSNGFPQVDGPRGVAVDSGGRVYVASKGNSAVMVFDSKGNQLGSVPKDDPIGVAV
jgi:DNA-binding beta-propeller fold protein YncE